MNDAFQQWLMQQQSSPLGQWAQGQQQPQPQPAGAPQPNQPNGKQLADALRNTFNLDQIKPGMGGLAGVIGKFAGPALGFLEQMNFSNKGRTPEGRAELKARVGPRPYGKGNLTGSLPPGLAQLFGGFGGQQ